MLVYIILEKFRTFESLREAVRTMSSEDLYRILAKYKFVLAMENAVCDDYV
jgi:hypothetical protein